MMTGLGPLLASLAAMDIAAFTRKVTRNAILYAFALVFVLTAYVLAVAALAIHLSRPWGNADRASSGRRWAPPSAANKYPASE